LAEVADLHSVYVVAPDDTLVRALNQHASDGWRAVSLTEALDSKAVGPDALVIVDLDEAVERRGFVETLRGFGFAGPVLLLGARQGQAPEDEPVARPVRLGTLLARIEAHWADSGEPELLELGPYEFVPAEQMLRDPRSDTVIRLTELERKLLLYLASTDGASVDREQLLAHVWGYSTGVDTHTVETHIWRLRQKIETEDPASRFLITEAGKYRLILAEEEVPG
jgi:DNA-binding response OmpR family regulator